jgi:protein tyrosine phosphatase (PTP) superfamily phosphohydrolase (DUF442 family)
MAGGGRWVRRIAIVGGIFLLAAVGAVGWLTFRTYHFEMVQQDVLYRCGNRGMAEFSNAVGRVHPKTVITLIDDQELNDPAKGQFRAEANYLAAHGIQQVRIPVKLGGWPDSEDVRKFLAIVDDRKSRPVLVHCAQGVRRTGMFVAVYQESAMNYDPAKAKEAVVSFGHSDHVTDDVKAFIDAYNPVTMTVATTMPAANSGE